MAPPRRPAPIQAIVGEDSYLAEAALAQVLAGAVGADQQESVRVLYGDEARWEDVLSAGRAGSLFATRRAVVVRRAELLKYALFPLRRSIVCLPPRVGCGIKTHRNSDRISRRGDG